VGGEKNSQGWMGNLSRDFPIPLQGLERMQEGVLKGERERITPTTLESKDRRRTKTQVLTAESARETTAVRLKDGMCANRITPDTQEPTAVKRGAAEESAYLQKQATRVLKRWD